jgi:hypothetical protein
MPLAVVSDVDDRDDVGVRQARGDARFVQEHRHEVFVALVLGSNELERDESLRMRSGTRPSQTLAIPPSEIGASTSYSPSAKGRVISFLRDGGVYH